MRVRAFLFAACCVLSPAGAAAESVFSESFQDGAAEGWAPSGGDVRLTTYEGNVALRLTRSAAAVHGVSTRDFSGVRVAAAMAAYDLEGDDYCLVEASGDGGRTWIEILRVSDGQDDGVTMHRNAVRDARFDGAERLLIGARVSGNADNDQCWLDDVRVSGERAGAGEGAREDLGAAWLQSAEPMETLASMRAFAPPSHAVAPQHAFNGTLRVREARGQMRVLTDALSIAAERALQVDTFPGFEIELVQDGGWLIPARRGPMPGAHPNWEVAIEPGRVWSEARDQGWTRAALPFALIETNANCTHNGALTFVFRGAEISRVAWQIASETCAYFKFDFWGAASASYTPGSQSTSALISEFRTERERRMRVEPISSLAAFGVDVDALASPADVDPAALTTYGVVYNGVHYRGGCETRAGPYPFCESLLLPSYSLAKSMVGGFGLMRLELLYPGAGASRIRDYVDACQDWGGVSLDNALDMATGRYSSPVSEADENALTTSRFFLSTTLAEKLPLACNLYPRREPPGRRWVYHTPDTFVLGAAMSELWRARRGAGHDFFDEVLAEGVYEPLGLSATMRATRRTYDEARQPFVGWGLTLLPDDVAKISAYLQNPDSYGQPLMAPRELAAAMQRDENAVGLAGPDANFRYNNGFWAWNAQAALECAHPVWTPFMSGFGGIAVAFLPNGASYYYFSDGGEYRWGRAVRALSSLAPMCEARQ